MINRFALRCVISIVICMLLGSNAALAKALLKPAGNQYMPIYCKSASADVRITGQFATTTLTLVYQHGSENDTEAEFVYELPDGAVATHFAYWAEDEKVIARIVEKQRAAEIYRKITAVNRDPALVEMIGKNKFRARISPVFAFKDLKIELVFVQVLASVGGDLIYTLPLGGLCDKDDDLEEINVNIRAKADENVIGVSNNYGLPVEKSGNEYSLTLNGINYNPPKDLSVRFKRKTAALLASVYSAPASSGGDGFFALALTPEHSLTSPKVSITGVSAYDIVQPTAKVKAGESILVCGRYKGAGIASVTLRDASVSYTTKVKFTRDAKAANLASKLWAAGMIEKLSKAKANRDAVVRMSLQYTLPSRYTSWLAVPKVEMVQFLYQKYSQQFDPVAEQWAKIMTAGEEQTAKGKKIQNQYNAWCAKIGFVPEEEIKGRLWEPMRGLAKDILKLCADGKDNTPEFAAKQARFNRLSKFAFPETEDGVGIMLAYYDTEPFQRLAKMIVDGKGESDEAKTLKARLSKLIGDKSEEILANEISGTVLRVSGEMVRARWGIKPDLDKAAKLEAKLERLAPNFKSQQWFAAYTQSQIYQTLRELSAEIMDLSERRKTGGAYQTLCNRYKQLLKEPDVHFMNIEGAAADRMGQLASQLFDLKNSKHPNNTAIKQVKSKMANLEKAFNVSSKKAIEMQDKQAAQNSIYEYVNLLEEGKLNSKEAIVLKKRIELLGKMSQGKIKQEIERLAADRLESLSRDYCWASRSRWPDPKAAKEIMASIHRMERVSGMSADEYLKNEIREWEDADKIEQAELLYGRFYMELCRNKPNKQRLENIKGQIKPLVQKYLVPDKLDESNKLLESGMAIADLQMEIRDAVARGDNAKAEESKKKRTEMLEEFRNCKYDVFRIGDPLISVEAPSDAFQVIAIMPDGEIKLLVYNADDKRWEGRFDVPAYAAEGSYSISIIVVDKDGNRNVIAMKYSVDVTAPQGIGAVASDAAQAKLQIDASADTARVVALLPWGARIELKNGEKSGSYIGLAAVPVEYQGKTYSTTFVLTDSAHNRTSITMDSSK
ncbi:MAG: VIT domain-containing protein [Armatimonadetes bacterium]|nr:VIT domain-containing protein [Armatimonadota bacterium]